MGRRMTAGLSAGITGLALVSLIWTGAAAAHGDETTDITCDGVTYTTESQGASEFNFVPRFEVHSTRVLVPLSFGELTATMTNPDGVIVRTITEPARFKGGSASVKGAVYCTINFTRIGDGHELPLGFTLTGSGSGYFVISYDG